MIIIAANLSAIIIFFLILIDDISWDWVNGSCEKAQYVFSIMASEESRFCFYFMRWESENVLLFLVLIISTNLYFVIRSLMK